jgi:predicted nucleotidyltransferase
MSDFDAESYASSWRKRNQEEKKRIHKREVEAHEEARRIARRLIEDAGADKVALFGSLAEGTIRNERFDIDLAIWGGNWFKAQEIAEESTFKIDIIEYEHLPPHVKKRIEQRGMVLQSKA